MIDDRPHHHHDHDTLTDASRGPRLQKVLAAAGVASRRAAETLIESGVVAVNGRVVPALPAFVDPQRDRITVRGRPVQTRHDNVYVMLFKPRGVICTNDDPEGRRRAIDLVRHPSRCRLYPVGRLDKESSGLLLLTNDGSLAQRLTHPRYGVHKVYEVTVAGRLDEADAARLGRGLFLPDRRRGAGSGGARTAQSRLQVIRRDRDRTRLLLELREGRNRQIRRLMARLGHRVRKLRRVRVGPLRLTGLRPGEWRDLTRQEIAALERATKRPSDKATEGGATKRRSDKARKGRRAGARRNAPGRQVRSER